VREHSAVFQAMLELYEADKKIDHLTVAEQLRDNNRLDEIGGADVVEELVAWVPATGHARDYGRIVREQAQMRALLDATREIQADVLNRAASPRELVEQAERAMLDVAHDERQKAIRSIAEVLHEETDRLHYRSKQKSPLTGTPSGFRDLDDLTGGFQPGNLVVLAARPSMGKSALVANMAESAALAGFPVALFSLEMSESELAQRFVASQAKVPGDDLRRGRVAESRWPKILEASGRLSDSPLFVDDSSDTGVLEIRAKSRRLHHQLEERGGLKLIIVDYLQLLRHEGRVESRVEQVGQVSRGLKSLARELKVPVIALSQLSRNVEQRAGDKKPILSDLRECVTGDTLVVLADGRRIPIAELVGTTPEVLALDERHRVVSAHSDAVWSVGRKPIVRVTLASGRTFRATREHRVLSGQGWRKLGQLSVGDRFALARQMPEPAAPERWPHDRVVLLGQLIGDGSYLSGQPMRYTTSSEANSHAVERTATREFGATVTRYKGRGGRHQLLISGNGKRWAPAGVGAWLRKLGIFNQRSHDKRVPTSVFRLANDQIALFLRHLWATDGCIGSGPGRNGRMRGRIYYATTSKGLANDVAALLLRLGIVARISTTACGDGRISNVVVSGGTDQRTFLEHVGAYGPRVAQALKLGATMPAAANSNVDSLPVEIWEEVRTAMAAGGITMREMSVRRGTSYAGSNFGFAPSRATVASYAGILESESLFTAAASDLFWDRIVAVEDDGEEEVFDLTVPGPACWLADGLVSHNSGQVEQDADLVMFIYREEYYNRESTRPGEADIIIAKHRNGPVGDITLTFQSQFPKFMNYAPPQFAG
ncbi:MAG: replicative DNA helicase, partial [Acidobacteriota bacterium]|nr:replicative DNA helicase [Acidobacteriota bacterium]